MISSWSGLARPRGQILAVSTLWDSIIIPEEASLTELWNEKVNDVLEGTGFNSIGLKIC